MAQTVQINLRIEKKLAQELERIAREESLRKTEVARKYLIEGVKAWKLERAIRRYRHGQISVERAAQEAGLSLYEILDELHARGVDLDQATPAQAREELQALLANFPATGLQ